MSADKDRRNVLPPQMKVLLLQTFIPHVQPYGLSPTKTLLLCFRRPQPIQLDVRDKVLNEQNFHLWKGERFSCPYLRSRCHDPWINLFIPV